MTTIIINDLATDARHQIIFSRPDDFQRADENWESEDKLLVELQHTDAFKGRTRWCDLNPVHFRFLILNNLIKVAALKPEEQQDESNPTMASLTFMLTSFIKCLEERTESTIELMRINRLSESEVLYDYAASVNMIFNNGGSQPRRGLRVIVDNT